MTDLTNAKTNTISISLFNRGLAGQVFEDLKRSGAKVVMKNNTPECVLLSPKEYIKLMNEVNDARLHAIATEREKNANQSNIISEDDAMKKLIISEKDIEDFAAVEIE